MPKNEPMEPWIRDSWAEACRGEFRQRLRGKGFLCHRYEGTGENLYDPLGVLCEIAVSANVLQPGTWLYVKSADVVIMSFKVFHGEQGLLPKEVVSWARLESQNPCVRLSQPERRMLHLPPEYQQTIGQKIRAVPLVTINDHSPATPDDIADMIMRL